MSDWSNLEERTRADVGDPIISPGGRPSSNNATRSALIWSLRGSAHSMRRGLDTLSLAPSTILYHRRSRR